MPPDLATGSLWHALSAPLGDPLVRRALLELCLVGVGAGALGCWVVLYGLSYSAESLSHSMLPGLVVAALLGASLVLGAGLGLVIAALAITLAGQVPSISRDTAVAVVVTSLFGLGALLALAPASPPGVSNLLFGDILGTSQADLWLAGITAAAVVGLLYLMHGPLLAVGFDRAGARSLGIRPALAEAALLVMTALVVLVAVQGLGNLLVVAVLVGPALAARQLTRRIAPMMLTSVALAALGGAAGLYLSYYADTAAGASIAASLVGLYVLAALVRPLRGHG